MEERLRGVRFKHCACGIVGVRQKDDAGLLVDPFDEQELAAEIARVVNNSDLRAELRVKGLSRAKAFSWTNTASLTLKAYERAIYPAGTITK